MLAFAVRGIVLLGVLSWYSATVWKMIDGYFKDQFHVYLQEEYRRYPRMKTDVKSTEAVDKKSVPSGLPAESSLNYDIAETYGPDAVCPADIADTCQRATAANGKPEEIVTGGTSENAAVTVATASTDKNAFPVRSELESRKLPSGSDTHDVERPRPGTINQKDGRKEEIIEESKVSDNVLAPPASTPRQPGKPRRRLDKKGSLDTTKRDFKEISREKPRKRRLNTIVLTDADFASARSSYDGDDDFSEFEEEEEGQKVLKEGILVSDLPFKPKADIGSLDRVTAEEFCPLTLEDEASCGETTTWP